MQQLIVVDTDVHQDQDGRFCLNDLHRAAMLKGTATSNQRPGNFMKRQETIDLIAAMEKRCYPGSITPVRTVKGNTPGIRQGTFVTKPLIYAYAMWIDADFHLDVIEAFDRGGAVQQDLWMQMQALVAKEVNSQVRATFGSHLMLKRKREIPPLRDERALLEAAIQPSLLTH
jgi:hypothetical protein